MLTSYRVFAAYIARHQRPLSVIFLFIPLAGNGMYILCTVDQDDTFLHGIKEIFYAKFTSVILPEIVQHDYR